MGGVGARATALQLGANYKAALQTLVVQKTETALDAIDRARETLKAVAAPVTAADIDLANLPTELAARYGDRFGTETVLSAPTRARMLQALQPAASDAAPIAAGARQVTLEEAKDLYLADRLGLVNLPEDGIKPGTYQNTQFDFRTYAACFTA